MLYSIIFLVSRTLFSYGRYGRIFTNYLLQDLVFSQHVKKLGFVQGVGKTRLEEDRENLTGDAYFTDGLRVVLVLTEVPTTINQIERFDWERLLEHYDKNLGH